jgi:hypothetical protein
MLVSPFVVLPTSSYSGGSRYAPAFLSGIGHIGYQDANRYALRFFDEK